MISSNEEKFLKQTPEEIQSRMSSLVKAETTITVWQKGGAKFHTIASEFHKKDQSITLLVDLEGKNPLVPGEYLIHFILRNVAYFAKGQVLTKDVVLFKILELFKHEKREGERLLTYPHHKAYILIPVGEKIEEVSSENLLYFSKTQDVKEKAFDKFGKYNDERGALIVDKKKYRQFRILDLSKLGASFFANSSEKIFLEGKKRLASLLIDFNGERYDLGKGEVLYGVDYVDPRATHVPMFKIGLKFGKENIQLSKLIKRYLGDIEKSDDLAKVFENNF